MEERLEFERYRDKIEGLIDRAETLIADVPEDTTDSAKQIEKAEELLHSDTRLRVSLLGQYNAGKSSLIKALTGADVGIDADVETTEVESIQWKGVEWVDTPGVHAQADRTTHDRIARDTAVDADLVVFVLTASGFNKRLAEYFHYVAGNDGLGLSSKMVVIVNKLDQHSAPVPNILADVEEAMAPHTDIPIQPAAIRDFLRLDEAPAGHREKLRQRSRIKHVRETLDTFIEEKGATGRLSRPLQLVEQSLEQLHDRLAGDATDEEREFLRRQHRVIRKEMVELAKKERTWKSEVRHAVTQNSGDLTDAVEQASTAEELQERFQLEIERAGQRLDETYGGIQTELQQWALELERKLEKLDASLLGESVLGSVEASTDKYGDVEFEDDPNAGFDYIRASKKLVDDGVSEFVDHAAKNPGWLRDQVYNIGKKLGKKFKPWEAVKKGEKFAKFFGKAGKVLPFLTFALDAWANFRDEQAAEKRARQKAKARRTIRRQLFNLADAQADALGGSLNELREDNLTPMLDDIDKRLEQLTQQEVREENLAQQLSRLTTDCKKLRAQIVDQ